MAVLGGFKQSAGFFAFLLSFQKAKSFSKSRQSFGK
jgi:hypothetical protein